MFLHVFFILVLFCSFFIPTRHYHNGEAEELNAHWDHEVYSIGSSVGESPEEAKKRLEEDNVDPLIFGIIDAKQSVVDVVAKVRQKEQTLFSDGAFLCKKSFLSKFKPARHFD